MHAPEGARNVTLKRVNASNEVTMMKGKLSFPHDLNTKARNHGRRDVLGREGYHKLVLSPGITVTGRRFCVRTTTDLTRCKGL